MPIPDALFSTLMLPISKAIRQALDAAYDAGGADMAKKVTAAVGASVLSPAVAAPRHFYGGDALITSIIPPRGSNFRPSDERMSPQKRGALDRLAPGVVKTAVHKVIRINPEGITRDGIRKLASDIIGQQIKEGSLKQSLRLLTKAGEIENRDRLWFPVTKNGGSSDD